MPAPPDVDPALWAEFQQVSDEVHRLFHQRKGADQPDAPAAPPSLKYMVDLPEEWVMLAFWISRGRADRRSGKNGPTGWPPERIADPDLRRAVLPVVRRHLALALNEHFIAELHDIATGGSALLRPEPPAAPASGRGNAAGPRQPDRRGATPP